MNIEHISISRSKSYQQCGYYYKLKYHLKVPNPGEEAPYFAFGKTIHKIAEVYVQERGQRSLGEVSTDVLRGKIEVEPGKPLATFSPDYKRRIPGNLRAIQKLTDSIGTEGELEYQFRYDLDPPHEKFVTGFIDRLVIKDDKAFIIDYKTTKKGPFRVNRQTILTDPQLRCYARVVNRNFGILAENIKCALYYLEDGELVAATYTEDSLLGIERELLETYNEIKASNPDLVWGKTGQHCQRCEYKDMCPFFKSSKIGKADTWDGTF